MKKIFLLLFFYLFNTILNAQLPQPPDKIYGHLFTDVQMSRIYPDSKTFVDCIPKREPKEIILDYVAIKKMPYVKFSLRLFLQTNFDTPPAPDSNYQSNKNEDIKTHIQKLWKVLKRNADSTLEGSSLLPLPHPYIVPGGRFREIYYWDSYFTMLGLQESGETEMMQNMIDNFAFLINKYGHIPNGNRTYYLSRSQPPFFSMMIELLAEKNGDQIYSKYKKELQKEYDYWMDKTTATKHIVKMPDGSLLNRYYDQDIRPRQEAFFEDSSLAVDFNGDRNKLYKNLRSCAESGWDFSSRWFADGKNLQTIQVLNLVPVDLNGLLYHLELSLTKAYRQTGDKSKCNFYMQAALKRRKAINKYLWNEMDGWYYDYNISNNTLSTQKTIAGISPFFFNVAPKENILRAKKMLQDFIKDGGVVTTLENTGQQWDAPNGWAPLQWITIKGLENYGEHELAKNIAIRWAQLNIKVYHATGKLMEKYNVTDTHLEAGGGEYPSQDGFGWTNGVLLKLMDMYAIKD